MSEPERRFNEVEIAAIIERATQWKEPPEPVPPGAGLTLGQLQDIGREIGIAPKVMADAADVLKDGGTTVIRRFLGLPVRVERNVKLRRRFSEDEWEEVVADLREIFNAAGVVEEDGSLRRWSNGNFQVVLEVNAITQRIRLRTFKTNALVLVGAGSGICGAASGALMATLWNTTAADARLVTILAVMAAAGALIVGLTALSLGPWVRRRHQQMAEVAARAIALDRSEPANNVGALAPSLSH